MAEKGLVLKDFKMGRVKCLYQEWYAGLLVFASKFLGQSYSFLAEDCVQDAIFKAFNKRLDFSSEASLKSFIYSCIKNQAIDILRKNQSKDNYISQQENKTEFINGIIEQETLNLLYSAINSLPDKYKQLFELNFEQGLKNAEIAKLLGVSESAVKKTEITYAGTA